MTVFLRWVDDLYKADGTTIEFCNELLAPGRRALQFLLPSPIIATGGDDMRLRIPVTQQPKVGYCNSAQLNHRGGKPLFSENESPAL